MLAKSKLNSIEFLISKALIDSYIRHDFFLVKNVLQEYDEKKEEIKNLKDLTSQFNKFIKQCYNVGWRVKNTEKYPMLERPKMEE